MITQYSRYTSSDGKRLFIVLGKWWNGNEMKDYEVLEVEKEEVRRIKMEVFEEQIRSENLIRVKKEV